jgi:hypothetical protein
LRPDNAFRVNDVALAQAGQQLQLRGPSARFASLGMTREKTNATLEPCVLV